MKSTAHVRRIFSFLAAVAIAALVTQRLLRPEGFGEVGHYRLGSLFEIMSSTPVHQGNEICGECHDGIHEVHEKDIHFNVKCEDCHGPGNRHVMFHMEEGEMISEESAAMPKEYTLEGCLFCHRKLAARPRTFPQIDPVEHYGFLRVNNPETRCIECHSPHEPLFLLKNVSEARIHPVIYECSDCHDAPPKEDHRRIDGHPVIFVCRDCHSGVVKDFETHNHAFLRCTACHLYHKENETAGRIFKNGNRRFCLLCHESREFKAEDKIPHIDSAEHIRVMAEDEGLNPEKIARETKACLLCHFDDIHDSDLVESEDDLDEILEKALEDE